MTTVVISCKDNAIVSFTATGHAGGGTKGNDIYCAAISAILQTAVIGLQNYAEADVTLDIRDGYLRCALPDAKVASDPSVRAITETMRLGLLSLAEDSGKHLKLVEEVL